jgi:lipid II:glycine glycyltransferase (peptidoglycan interpeptide bridge formation enzyme)
MVQALDHAPREDLRQSPGYAKYMGSIGWQVDYIGNLNIFRRRLPLIGSLIRIPRPNLPLPLEEIRSLAKGEKAFLVKIEPNLLQEGLNPRSMGGFKKDSSPILPTRTIWIDLTASEETLWGNLDKDARNLVRRAEKEGVAILESDDPKSFYELWADNARQKGFYISFEKEILSLWKSFSEKHILVAKHGGKVVAAALLLAHDGVLYYSFAASNDPGRDVHAPYQLMWETVKRGKNWGYQRIDLEGIEDPKVSRTKKWHGFSEFKRQFGGREVEYVGSFSKYYSSLGKIFGRFI